MRYFALASDYDGTLAINGQVGEETLAAMQRLRDSGRKLILVTGRPLTTSTKSFLSLIDLTVLWQRTVHIFIILRLGKSKP
jgi:HAD superfamily hydrolase (TIGR01484 family)